jgi:putative transposase
MDEYESLSHSKWERKYHVVFIPGPKESALWAITSASWGRSSGHWPGRHLMPDHVHIMISIPPKYAVSQVVGFMPARVSVPDQAALSGSLLKPRLCRKIIRVITI